MDTPWGIAQHEINIGSGMIWVSTASHGGLYVPPELRMLMPKIARHSNGWYEEDCDWAIPYCLLPASCFAKENRYPERRELALETLKNWNPDIYEKYTGTVIPEGESIVKDERLFNERNKNNLVVISAWGNWHVDVPTGFVGVLATVGGVRSESNKRYFLVPKADYKPPFVIADPSVYQEVGAFK